MAEATHWSKTCAGGVCAVYEWECQGISIPYVIQGFPIYIHISKNHSQRPTCDRVSYIMT